MALFAGSDVIGGIFILLFVLSCVVGVIGKFVARVLFRWHEAGSIGPGDTHWHH
ncbi:MAG: hypothetical protein IIC81_03000 [Chloroflexi bacterium]|nr:hypothetical protein [Chloroflexota bacterium]